VSAESLEPNAGLAAQCDDPPYGQFPLQTSQAVRSPLVPWPVPRRPAARGRQAYAPGMDPTVAGALIGAGAAVMVAVVGFLTNPGTHAPFR